MDFSNIKSLYSILQDEEVMYAYNGAFSEEEAMMWMRKQLQQHKDFGLRLWTVYLKGTNEMISQCDITMQEYKATQIPKIRYLFAYKYWHKCYAVEVSIAYREYGFNTLHLDALYSIIRGTNLISQKVALRNGMQLVNTIANITVALICPMSYSA